MSSEDWRVKEVEDIAGFDWELWEALMKGLAGFDEDAWTEVKSRIVDQITVSQVFEIIRSRGAEASAYHDEDGSWRQSAMAMLDEEDPVLSIWVADALNQIPNETTFKKSIKLLVQVFGDSIREGGTRASPDKGYLLDKANFDYLPANLKREMPKYIRDLVNWKGQFARIRILKELERARALTVRFPHCKAVIDGILDDVERNWGMGSDIIKLQPTLLVGPPGIGKSMLVRELSRALDLHVQIANVGGMSENHLFGLSAGWHSAHAGIVTQAVASARVLNPLVVLDEIDKTHSGRNGDITGELLGLLEPLESRRYREKYLATDVDASHVNWMFTANNLSKIPSPLRSRCVVHEVPLPTMEQIPAIIRSLVQGYADAHGLRREFFLLTNGEVADLAETYQTHKSVRVLNRLVTGYLSVKAKELRIT